MARKKLNVFSLSFLDIITCGLGAIILLFVLVNAKSAARRDSVTTDLRAETNRVELQILEEKKTRYRSAMSLRKSGPSGLKPRGLRAD